MLEKLFGSKTRAKVLVLFFTSPGRQFHLREISRKVDLEINAVSYEVLNLQKIGFLKTKNIGRKKIFLA